MTLATHPYHCFFIVVLVTLGHLLGGLKGAEIALVSILSLMLIMRWFVLLHAWWEERKFRRLRSW